MSKSINKDLKFIFNDLYKTSSERVLILGEVSYKMLIDDNVGDSQQDIKNRINRIISSAMYVDYLKMKNIKKELNQKMEKPIEILDTFCAATKSNKLGKKNHIYSAKSNAEKKLNLKFLRACNLRSTATD